MKFSTLSLGFALVLVGCKGAANEDHNLAGTGGAGATTTSGTGNTTTTGTGGTGAAPGSTSATWIPTLSTSVNGWTKAQGGASMQYTPGQTATASASDGTTVVCGVLYGPSNVLSCSGALSCTWLSTDRNVLASKHGQAVSDAYLASQQGAADAAADALSCTLAGSQSCSSEYVWRGVTGLGALPLEDAQGGISNNQFQIACAVMAPSFPSFIMASSSNDNVSADGDVMLTAELDSDKLASIYGI